VSDVALRINRAAPLGETPDARNASRIEISLLRHAFRRQVITPLQLRPMLAFSDRRSGALFDRIAPVLDVIAVELRRYARDEA
jgi:hypothetical protein